MQCKPPCDPFLPSAQSADPEQGLVTRFASGRSLPAGVLSCVCTFDKKRTRRSAAAVKSAGLGVFGGFSFRFKPLGCLAAAHTHERALGRPGPAALLPDHPGGCVREREFGALAWGNQSFGIHWGRWLAGLAMASAGLGTGSPNIVSVARRSVSMDLCMAVWRAAPPETGSWDLGLFGVGVRVSVALFGNGKERTSTSVYALDKRRPNSRRTSYKTRDIFQDVKSNTIIVRRVPCS